MRMCLSVSEGGRVRPAVLMLDIECVCLTETQLRTPTSPPACNHRSAVSAAACAFSSRFQENPTIQKPGVSRNPLREAYRSARFVLKNTCFTHRRPQRCRCGGRLGAYRYSKTCRFLTRSARCCLLETRSRSPASGQRCRFYLSQTRY